MKLFAALLFLLCILLPVRYTGGIPGYLPGLSLLFLVLLSGLYLWRLRKGIRFETESSGASCERGREVEFELKLRNRSVLACSNVQIELFLSGFGGRETRIPAGRISIAGKSETVIPLKIRMDHIGVYEAGVRQLRIDDLLGAFGISLKERRTFRIIVLPRSAAVEDVELREKRLTENRDASRTAVTDGFDYTGVQEYALGDPMKKIHWKISARSPGYVTKLTESSRRNDLTILVDLIPSLSRQKDPELLAVFPDLFDALVETALTLSLQAIRKDVECSLLFVGRDGETTRYISKEQEEFEDLVLLLPNQLPGMGMAEGTTFGLPNGAASGFSNGTAYGMPNGADLVEQESRLDNRSANVIMCTSELTETLTRELIHVMQQQRHPELYYIVPRDYESERHPDEAARLELLDDYGICCHVISAEQTSTEQVEK